MDAHPIARGRRFEFSGGALCLDFVNTLGDRPRCRSERLAGYPDLLAWGVEAGLLDPAESRDLTDLAGRADRQAEEVFRRAVAFREGLYRLFSALTSAGEPGGQDLAALNEVLAHALGHLRIQGGGRECRWSWIDTAGQLECVLWPVARSAADLLTSTELPHLRECGSETCSWLFVDRSRGHRRRWCDMKTCGNRAKARRHYRRKKAAAT